MKKKLIAVFTVVLVLFIFWTFDYFHAKQFQLEFIEVSEQPSPADGRTEMDFIIRVTKNGEPVSGHDLFGVVYGRGGFKARRVRTDENGNALFTYLPFVARSEKDTLDIPFEITDESNSVFIEVKAKYDGVIPLKIPDEEEDDSDVLTMDDIFGIND